MQQRCGRESSRFEESIDVRLNSEDPDCVSSGWIGSWLHRKKPGCYSFQLRFQHVTFLTGGAVTEAHKKCHLVNITVDREHSNIWALSLMCSYFQILFACIYWKWWWRIGGADSVCCVLACLCHALALGEQGALSDTVQQMLQQLSSHVSPATQEDCTQLCLLHIHESRHECQKQTTY